MEQQIFSRWFAKRLVYLAAAAVLFGCVLSMVLTKAVVDGQVPAWSAPSAMAIRQASKLAVAQSEPNFLNNLDCTPLSYRLAATSSMLNGCFTETAFGLMDTDSGAVIFSGTDEGLPLLPHTAHQILVPWKKALDLLGLDPIGDGGTLISLYKNPLAAIQDQRNFLGQLTGKKLDRPPDMTLKDSLGRPLVINPQTMAFSEGGGWLVAETLGGAFVRINLATLSMTAFAPAYGSQGSPGLLKSRVAITNDGRFVAIANDIATAFKVYDLATCDGVINNLQPQNCRSYDYWPFARQQISGLQSIRHLRFINEGLLSFDAVADDTARNGIYELAPAAGIDFLTDYIGLGDSYTSGEGAFDYLNGTDTPDNMCHLSRNSYPLLLTHDLFSGAGGHSVACSGAVIKDVGSTAGDYRGQVSGIASLQELKQSQPLLLESVETNFIPGYIAQQRFIQRWQPRIATVSVGGDDIGFGDLVRSCVEPHISRHLSDNTCYSTYEDRLELVRLIDRTVPRWVGLYKQLQREAPAMRLYAIGYPQLVADTGNCALNVQLNKSELEFAAGIIDYLNQNIRKAAGTAGVPYVDISKAFAGHRLCEAASYDVAINGLTAGTDAGFLGMKLFGKESYHPNALGQTLIEQEILKQTRNFEGADSSGIVADTAPAFLNVPASGRPINTLIPDAGLTDSVAKRGLAASIHVSGSDDGLRSSAPYAVRLDGPMGVILATIVSTAEGNLEGSFTIPSDTVPGGHTVDVTGENQGGEPVDIRQPVYVPATDADSDGDGIDDITDSCPGAVNSNEDRDQDGTDDICDNLVGQPAAITGSGSMTNGRAGSETTTISSSSKGVGQTKARPHVLGVTAKHGIFSHHVWTAGQAIPKAKHQSFWPLLIIFPLLGLLAKRYIQKPQFQLQWRYMNRVRKGFVYLLSLLLLATLLGTAISTSTNNTLSKPKKVETYLAESKLYDHFIAYTADQAKKTNGDNDQSGSVSLSDAAVQTAAQSSFTPNLIQKSVNTFIDSNYAWLEGKTETPNFKIDLSSQKQTFAEKVGQYVKTYSATLPVCASPQIALQQSTDPLAATCRPAEQTPEAIGAQVTQRITSTGDFLSDPVITAASVNPKGNPQSKPYYEKLSHLPQLYRIGLKLPYIFAILSILTALGVIFLSLERRKGVRKVGIVLLIAGVVLVVLKFVADFTFNRLEKRLFNSSDIGQLQQSLTDFAHRIETSMVRTDLWFGLGFLLLAAIIFGILAGTRRQKGSSSESTPSDPSEEDTDEKSPIILSRKRLERPAVKDLTPRARPEDDTPETPKSKKPPRLVQ